jgi:glyoxylase-like metal-dependent hydrolase (beta-lactamase superfamily II)
MSDSRVASLIKSGEGQSAAIERAPGVYESRGVGNSYLLTTREGDVLVNAGTLADARRGRALFAKVSGAPLRYIVLTQSHANQYGGLEVYKSPDNVVIAQRRYPEERRHAELLSAHYRRGSRRIFGAITGPTRDIVPTREVAPDLLIDAHHTFELGGRRFELHSVPGGETRSALFVWLPDERIALVGNLFGPLFGNQPNLNTIRGDRPRSAREFIDSVEKLRALKPTLVLTGHEQIEQDVDARIARIADSVRWLHDQVVEGMNAGVPLRRLMREVILPPELALTEEYGKVAWNVRAIWHEYTGWFDPDRGTPELYGSALASVVPALAELLDVERLAARATRFVEGGQPLEALQLLSLAEDHTLVRAAKRSALELLLARTDNLFERRWLETELSALEG